MFKFRVMLMALAATAVIAAGQVGVAQAVLICADGGNQAGSPATLAGTYTFTFSGANVLTNVSPLAASGSVTLNGNGRVTGGIINCNQAGQFNTPITGGCYTINSDGPGFIAITTSLAVCGQYVGVDLQIAISQPYGVQFQFSSDANDVNSETGFHDAFSGTANRL